MNVMTTRILIRNALLGGALAAMLCASSASATRVKDIASLSGVRENALQGYGLVIGLNGTGDSASSLFTNQSLAGLLSRSGIKVSASQLRTKNVAAVMITAKLPAFSAAGTTIDIVVSSVGDSKSLRGGSLLVTPLYGLDRNIYAVATGQLSVGGFSAGGSGSKVTKNHPTVGRVPGGATIERELGIRLEGRKEFVYLLNRPDFTTAANMAKSISAKGFTARAIDARRVVIDIPEDKRDAPVGLIADIESATVETDVAALVVLNERTGTVVMGSAVRISDVAVAHGGLQVEVRTRNRVSQPGVLANGDTARLRNSDVTATQATGSIHHVKATATLAELVKALNTLGVTPGDLIEILQQLKSAGALQAEIVIE